MNGETQLAVRDLEVHYGPIRAVKGISFEIPKGRVTALIGANGAGKSSILRALSGMIPYSGTVSLDGRDLAGLTPERRLALGIAHVPEGRGIFANLTVLENLRLSTWQRMDTHAVSEDLSHVFELFPRLKQRSAQFGGTLSGGEQQMLALARALMSRAGLLLLDEPSMGLAPVLVREIFHILEEINRSAGTTILLVEQNANMALRLASRAFVLETGTISMSGSGRELLDNPLVRAAYLGG